MRSVFTLDTGSKQNKLLIGIGNSARQDDGLGWAFAEEVKRQNLFDGDIILRFQLNLEDADLICRYSKVYFADACADNLQNGYKISRCIHDSLTAFSSHILGPGSLLGITADLYNFIPESFLIAMQGYTWELQEGITDKGKENLFNALHGFRSLF